MSILLNLERKFLIFIIKKSVICKILINPLYPVQIKKLILYSKRELIHLKGNSLSKILILKCSVQEWNIDKTNTNEYYKYLHPKPFSKLIY